MSTIFEIFCRREFWCRLTCISLIILATSNRAQELPGTSGYYRFPTLHGDTLVFVAEGDLWRTSLKGGLAQRLTSHPGSETHPVLSPDGKTIAFSAEYEGPAELYTMPTEGGLPTRRTFAGGPAVAQCWTPAGEIIYETRVFSSLPDWQLAIYSPQSGQTTALPLSQASEGVVDPPGKTLYFTRQHFQGSSTKRYQGGTAQNLWKFALNATEAVPLTADFAGTSKNPMLWNGRVFFLSDRDGTMNIWSMNLEGGDLTRHTAHRGWEIKSASLSEGRIVYQLGADLHLFELATKADSIIPIRLASDLDQEREKWVKKPLIYLTAAHPSPDGDRVALTARGQIFIAPTGQGRFVNVTHDQRIRYRDGRFLPDGKSLLALSDEKGELEFFQLPANGVGKAKVLTQDGTVFRQEGLPSPDGKWIAHQDKNWNLWLLNLAEKTNRLVGTSKFNSFAELAWSPDSQWLALVSEAENTYRQILLYHLANGSMTPLTSDRVNSSSPVWSPDGKWIYFISERRLHSLVSSPWGPRAPEPFFTDSDKLYLVSLLQDGHSPFAPKDELHIADKDKTTEKKKKKNPSLPEDKNKSEAAKPGEATSTEVVVSKSKGTDSKSEETKKVPVVSIDLAGLAGRVEEIPVPPGNYRHLSANDQRLYWMAQATDPAQKPKLMTLEITNEEPKPKAALEDLTGYEMTADGKKLMIRKEDEIHVVDASEELKLKNAVDLKSWTFSFNPRDEWRQMFVESWRLMRDYFYDTNLHGVDWKAMRDKYLPVVERVTDRDELNDLIADLVGELSALHIFVFGGDSRDGTDSIKSAGLGANLSRDETQGGYRVEHVYQSDPDYPERTSPLAKPGVNLPEGTIIQAINGIPTLTAPSLFALLRNQADKQVLLTVKTGTTNQSKDIIIKPISRNEEADLRYHEWEYSRRLKVEAVGKGEIGYVHLRTMGSQDVADWARDFYPVFNRQGLIIDVRHNGGGNIDSWILEKLMRKAWFFWQARTGIPTSNMQYAFRGHAVVLCDEHTGSDGEAFTEGFRRLGLGKVIGTRTWGGEIWLSMDNILVDQGIASAAEYGVYGPEGKWLIEGHGVDPDITVDNLPHATFNGQDAQLQAALDYLQEQIRLHPAPVPPVPPYPNKALK